MSLEEALANAKPAKRNSDAEKAFRDAVAAAMAEVTASQLVARGKKLDTDDTNKKGE